MQKFTKSVYQNTGDDHSHPNHHLGMAHHKQLGLNNPTPHPGGESAYQNTGDDNSHPTHHLGMAHHKQLGLNKFTQPKVKVIRDACIVKKWIQRDSLTRCILHFEYMIKQMIYCNLLYE